MLGLAEKGYLQAYGRLPWQNKSRFNRWPALCRWANMGLIPWAALFLAEAIFRKEAQADESAVSAIVYLAMASQAGSLSISLQEGTLCPDPAGLIRQSLLEKEEGGSEPFLDLIPEFSSLIIKGLANIPEALVQDMAEETLPPAPLCRWGGGLYFQKNWIDETHCMLALRDLLSRFPLIEFSQISIDKKISKYNELGKLTEEQGQAASACLQNAFSILSGGPGTGKTYTAGFFLRIYWELLSLEQKKACRIALAAPTGKAVVNLRKSLARSSEGIEGLDFAAAGTLHQLLGLSPNRVPPYSEVSHLPYEIIIVDECSMIEAPMMARLLRSVKRGARIVLLGDPFQLPPVGMGSVFSDLIRCCRGKSFPVGELTFCSRSESKAIVDFAASINRGEPDMAWPLFGNEIIQHSLQGSIRQLQQELVASGLDSFLSLTKGGIDDKARLELLGKFCLLSPLRKGPFGVDRLNQLFLQRIVSAEKGRDKIFLPILVVRNNFERELMNGDHGLLCCSNEISQGKIRLKLEDYAIFPDIKENGVRRIPAALLPRFEYGFCLSVHKSQGSEFDKIAVVLPSGTEAFGREVLYTAVTRARKRLELWTGGETFRNTVEKTRERGSLMAQRFSGSPSSFFC